MTATVIKGGYLMKEDGLKKDWGLRIEDNKITQVAPNCELIIGQFDNIIEAKNQIIAPGFVNGHMHMYGVLSHGITAETLVTEFSSFLEDFWWPYVENRLDHNLVRATTKWACVEMIKSGITSFTDVLEGPNSIPGALDVEAEEIKKAGLRAFLSFEACERMSKENGQLGLKENADFVKANNKEGNLVQGMMSVHTLFTGSKEYMKQAKKMADELNCDIHMHLSESVFEPNWCLDEYGKRPVDVYEEIDYLDKNVFASQAVQMEDYELDIIAKRGSRVVSMPLSNCEVGGGVAPVSKMLSKGIHVGLGTDGYINNYFEVMRGAFLIHKAYQQDPQVMPAKDVYKMGTSMGAEAMGLKNAGKLEEGYLADIITINIDCPTPINQHNVYDQLILFRNPENVNDVMVDGKFIKRNGKLLTVDEEAIKEELRQVAQKFWLGK
ncbi:MAG: amidohydrolase [Clostridiales bacterium]|jgi:cytosine/adenosine deaminase-related metal-dependent hydrolase|nr:amidohydrolase [Clostridiales bacterium]